MGRFSTIALLCLGMLACGSNEQPRRDDVNNPYDYGHERYERDAGIDDGFDFNETGNNSDILNDTGYKDQNDADLGNSDLRDLTEVNDAFQDELDLRNDYQDLRDAELNNGIDALDLSQDVSDIDLRDQDLNIDFGGDVSTDASRDSFDSTDSTLELDNLDIETDPEDETRVIELRLFNTVPLDLYDGGNPNLSVSNVSANGLIGYEISEDGITLVFDDDFRGDTELTIEAYPLFSNFTSHRMVFDDEGIFHDRAYLEFSDGKFRMFVPAVPLINEDFLDYVKNMMNINESRGIFRYQGPDIDAAWTEGEPQSTWHSGDIVITRPMPLYLPPELYTHRIATENAVSDINSNGLEWYAFVDMPFDERVERGVRVYSGESYRYMPRTYVVFDYGEEGLWAMLSSARVEFIDNASSQESILEELMHSLGGHPEPLEGYSYNLNLQQQAILTTEISIVASTHELERLYDITQLWLP